MSEPTETDQASPEPISSQRVRELVDQRNEGTITSGELIEQLLQVTYTLGSDSPSTFGSGYIPGSWDTLRQAYQQDLLTDTEWHLLWIFARPLRSPDELRRPPELDDATRERLMSADPATSGTYTPTIHPPKPEEESERSFAGRQLVDVLRTLRDEHDPERDPAVRRVLDRVEPLVLEFVDTATAEAVHVTRLLEEAVRVTDLAIARRDVDRQRIEELEAEVRVLREEPDRG